jgi:hypothetical protein
MPVQAVKIVENKAENHDSCFMTIAFIATLWMLGKILEKLDTIITLLQK